MDTASLVIGIISVIIGFIPCIQVFVFLPALVGLILGVVSFIRKRQVEEPTGTALAVFVGIGADASTIDPMVIK